MKRPVLLSVLIFVTLLALTLLVVHQQSLIIREDEDQELQQKLEDIQDHFRSVLNENIAAASTLAILYSEGSDLRRFDTVAEDLIRTHKYLDIIYVTNKFVIAKVYPLEGSEVIVGRSLVADSFRRAEVLTALKRKQIEFTGPYMMFGNRGMAIAGRVPFYVGGELKGFSIVITRLSTIKRLLDTLVSSDNKLVYELSKVNPVTHKVEYFFQNSQLKGDRIKTAYMPEGDWQLHVGYAPGYKTPNNLMIIWIMGILLSLLVAIYIYTKIIQKQKLEKTVALKTHQLTERVKELSTIYYLNNIFKNEEQNEEDVFRKIVTMLPSGWQYVDVCRAKISFEGKDYVSPGYEDAPSKQREDFRLADGRCGTIEIVYLQVMPQEAEGPFLKEERDLINSIARSLEVFLNKQTEEKERKKIQRDLELALSLRRATIESTADGILVVDTSGRISDYNTHFLNLWAIPETIIKSGDASAALAFAMKQVVDPREFESKIKEVTAHPQQESLDIIYFLDGRVFERHSKPQVAENEIVGRVWNFRDITRQKRSEEEIKQLNADLEKRVQQRTEEVNKLYEELKLNVADLKIANSDLESFNYSVSHDLRAPLRAINGYVSMLVRKRNILDETTNSLLDDISRNTKKMDTLIEELLSFARAGKKELEKVDLDMNQLLQDVLSSINIHEWNAQTQLIARDMLPAYGDTILLKQALFNLVSNAVKYSREKERPVIEVGSYTSGDENTYFVKDNGAGFDMKYYDKLFKVFQRMHSSSEFEGVGVGLAIVARIIMKHKGKVWAEAKEGEGATFYFAIPAFATSQQKE